MKKLFKQTAGVNKGNIVALLKQDGIVKVRSIRSGFKYFVSARDFEKYYSPLQKKKV